MSIETLIRKTLNEGNISIQVIDPELAIVQLKKRGVPAKIDPKYDDEILIDLKYKTKILAWMMSDEGGWDSRDLMGVYDELLESNEEVIEEGYEDKFLPKALKKFQSLLPEVKFTTKGKTVIIGKYNNKELLNFDFDVENDDWTDNKDVDMFVLEVEYGDESNMTREPAFLAWINNYDKEFKALNASLKAKDDAKIKKAIQNLF